jgi:hypothetical protein
MRLVLEIEVPDTLASQVVPMLERQQMNLAPNGGGYGYAVPSEAIFLCEIKAPAPPPVAA